MHKVLIGLISYNDLPLLRESIPAIEELREYLPADVVVIDTAHNDEVRDFFKKEYPDIHYFRHPDGNIGYGRGHSEIIRKFPNHKYYLAHQSDLIFDAANVKKILKRMEHDSSITMCAGKLYWWDLENHRKTRQIDSFGIEGWKKQHFFDRGQGEEDRGQYDETLNNVFGISGATFLIRTSVIPELHGSDWELFDPRMWMYKEDIDLSYRLRWLGKKIVIFPEIWGWHARTVANREGQGLGSLVKAQEGKADYSRRHSYKNHLLLLKNHFSWRYGPVVVLRMLIFEFAKGLYMLLRHPSVFFEGMKTLFTVAPRRSDRLVSAKHMLSYFN